MTSPLRLAPRVQQIAARAAAAESNAAKPGVARAQVDGFERKSVTSVLVLQRGMTGSVVTGLQQKLVAARFMSQADFKSGPGVYGPRTEAAVRRLQAYVGLPATGVAGPSTFSALNSGTRYQERAEITAPITMSTVHARLSETFPDEVTQPLGSPI
jgi:peptidoglycan hydrolase-like protein with peptidoglycan-binding domain